MVNVFTHAIVGQLYREFEQWGEKYRLKINALLQRSLPFKRAMLNKVTAGKYGIIVLLSNVGLFSEDALLRQRFTAHDADTIYTRHIQMNFKSCVFCTGLTVLGNSCCGICTLGKCKDATFLLPEPFAPSPNVLDSNRLAIPWIFRTPCESFERIDKKNYFKNFKYRSRKQAIVHYEILQGLFLGICHQKRPCHICASVDKRIYQACLGDRNFCESTPCGRAFARITSAYGSRKNLLTEV